MASSSDSPESLGASACENCGADISAGEETHVDRLRGELKQVCSECCSCERCSSDPESRSAPAGAVLGLLPTFGE